MITLFYSKTQDSNPIGVQGKSVEEIQDLLKTYGIETYIQRNDYNLEKFNALNPIQLGTTKL